MTGMTMMLGAALQLSWHALGHEPLSSRAAAEQRLSGHVAGERARPAYLAHFRDGPRSVPTPSGPAKTRADQLGIGTIASARMLLTRAPTPELLREVGPEKVTQLLWPVVHGEFGRGFGFTRRLRKDLPHNGVDIAAARGTAVRAAAPGLVTYSDNGLRGYGNCVMILHAGGALTLYAHNSRTTVQAGQWVERGERIALVGQTGYAWGPHLHFELRVRGRLRDPMRTFVGKDSDILLVHEDNAEPEPPQHI